MKAFVWSLVVLQLLTVLPAAADTITAKELETEVTASCSCRAGIKYFAPILNDGCRSYMHQYTDILNPASGVKEQCPPGTIFDLDSCSCYDSNYSNCPRKCPDIDIPYPTASVEQARAIDSSCFCEGSPGNYYFAVSSDDCTTFYQSTDMNDPLSGAKQMCAPGTIFDVSTCGINSATTGTCPDNCPLEANPCPSASYRFNPYSQTCFRRLDGTRLDWTDSAAACAADGETLAVFDTVESFNWFSNLRQTERFWKRGQVWIGAKSDSGNFKWYGRKETAAGDGVKFTVADWEQVQPSFSGDCVKALGGRRTGDDKPTLQNFKWDDVSCSEVHDYICELDPNAPPGGPVPVKTN